MRTLRLAAARVAARLTVPAIVPLTALGVALAASGCTVLPAAGPSTDAVLTSGGADDLTKRYEIIDLDPATVDSLKGRPADSLLASFGDHRPSAEPLIGVGDALSVTIWEAGSGGLFSGPLISDRFSAGSKSAAIPEQIVTRDGSISIPYAGRVAAAGRRPQDVGAEIEAALAGKAIQPQVLVSITQPVSNTVTVIGEAAASSAPQLARTASFGGGGVAAGGSGGGRVPLSTRGDRLLDVLAVSGGIRSPVSETFVRLSRGPATATVPMTTVVSNPRENIFLRAGDIVTLVRDPQTFIATGATGVNFEVPFDAEGITLSQALAKARGLSDLQADPAGVFLFRFEPESVLRRLRPGSALLGARFAPVVYRINMRDPNSLFLAQAFRMRNRDVIYVSNAPFVEVQKVLSVFATVTSPIAAAASTYAYVR